MTDPSESQASVAPSNRRRAGRRFTSVAVLATMAVMVGPVVQVGGDADQVGTLSPSMVEMLGDSSGSSPVSLEYTRKAVEAYFDTKGLDGTGIDVAVIDTGVAPVEGLGPDKWYSSATTKAVNKHFKPKLPAAMRKAGYSPATTRTSRVR